MSTSLQHLELVDATRWRELAPTFDDYSYRHQWEYAQACARRSHADSECIALIRDGRVEALAEVRLKRLPLLPAGVAYLSGGPLVRRGDDIDDAETSLEAMLGALADEYARRRGFVLRSRPSASPGMWNERQHECYVKSGFERSSDEPSDRTILVDLDRTSDAIRASFAQKWRNGLNASERAGVRVRRAETDEDWRQFIELHEALCLHKSFDVDQGAGFFDEIQRQGVERQVFALNLAEQEGIVVAGHLSSCLGDTCVYLLGAAGQEGRRTKASYLLQWKAVMNARDLKMRAYDLGGIDPAGNPGVHRFKRGMGGVEQSSPGPFELAPTALRRAITKGAERAYRAFSKHRRQRSAAGAASA